MKVVDLEGTTATVELSSLKQKCDVSLVPDVKVGDYVIIHAGFAIEILDEEEARETLALLEAMGTSAEEGA